MQRLAIIILETERTADGQYIPCIVKEGERGYYRTDWAWGKDKKIAEACATSRNERSGLSEDDVTTIVGSSMFAKAE